MSAWTYSAVLVCHSSDKNDANQLALALDYGPGTFSVPASATGAEPATHYFAHSWANEIFVGMIAAAGQGELPPAPWEDFGLTAEQVGALLIRMTISIRDQADPIEHVADILTSLGIQKIV